MVKAIDLFISLRERLRDWVWAEAESYAFLKA